MLARRCRISRVVCLWTILLGCPLTVAAFQEQPEKQPEKKELAEIKSVGKLGGFDDWVTSVRFSPDGTLLATGSYDVVKLWEAQTRKLVSTLKTRTGYAHALVFTPDGGQLLAAGYQKVTLWDVKTGKRVGVLSGHRGYVTGMVLSADANRLVTCSEDQSIRFWNLEARQELQMLVEEDYPAQGVALTPDGKWLATVSGDLNRVTRPGLVKLWNLETGRVEFQFPEHLRAATSLTFTPDGHYLITTSEDEKINVYDIPARKAVGFFSGHSRPTTSAVVAPDGRTILSGSGGRAKGKNEIKVWDRTDGAEWGGLEAHEEKITQVALSPDGKTLATASHDKTVGIWNVEPILQAVAKELKLAPASETPAPAPLEAPRPQVMFKVEDAVTPEKTLRVGIIGLDTSHVPAFTKVMNDPKATGFLGQCQVVAAYPQGSPDIESSVSRVPKYTEELRAMGVEIVDSIPALLEKVDVVLLETNDGRPHLEQVLPCLKAGKKVFIDKPLAGSLTDCVAIFLAAEHYGAPVFSSSSLRFSESAQQVRNGSLGDVLGCDAYSPASLEKTHPDLFWYGIHGVETLFTVMGPGCQSVTRAHTNELDVVTGVWSKGRIGTFRGIRSGASGYGGTAFGTKGIGPIGKYDGYAPLVAAIAEFFHTGKVPVTPEETLEIYAFMEAADVSKKNGGIPVELKTVLNEAREEAVKKLAALGVVIGRPASN